MDLDGQPPYLKHANMLGSFFGEHSAAFQLKTPATNQLERVRNFYRSTHKVFRPVQDKQRRELKLNV